MAKTPKFVKYHNQVCAVIDWRDATVAFRFEGRTLWRDHSAVEIVED